MVAGGLVGAVEASLPEGGSPALRELALTLARTLDESGSARDRAGLSKELRAVLAELGAGVEVSEGDVVDDLARKRAERRGAEGAVGS